MRIREWLFHNFSLKVIAFFLAVLTWIIIIGKERSHLEKIFEVKVDFFNVAKNVEVRNIDPPVVFVTVKGITKEMKKLSPDDFKIKVDLKNISENADIVRFAENCLDYPRKKVSLVSIHPMWIEFKIEEYATRDAEVVVRRHGQLPRGLRIVDLKVNPPRVRIFGYRSKVGSIHKVIADLFLDKIDSSQRIILPLEKNKDILRYPDSDSVEVFIQVKKNGG